MFSLSLPNDDKRARMVDVSIWVGLAFPELELHIALNQPMLTHYGTHTIDSSAAFKHMETVPKRATTIRGEQVMRERSTDFGKMFARQPGASLSTTNSSTSSFSTSSRKSRTTRFSGTHSHEHPP